MPSSQWLPFMSNEALCDILSELKTTADKAALKAEKNFNSNVIDPFTALFQIQLLSITANNWPEVEKQRQIEKTFQNHIGNFHQKLLGNLNGWNNLGTKLVVDLVARDRKIIAEVKNKHNTLKASDQAPLYDKLHSLVRKKGQDFFGYTAYYVEIIPKKPTRYDIPFTPSDNTTGTKKAEDQLIRKIDGASFYALATGHEDGMIQLFRAIPKALKAIGIKPLSAPEMKMLESYYHSAFTAI